jgi:ribonuclease Z
LSFQLTILGSASASPILGGHPSSQLLAVDNDYFLIDCGEGTQYRLLEQNIRVSRLKAIFISHLHGDHYFGLFGLLNSLSLSGRKDELFLYGPKGLGDLLTTLFRYSHTVLSYSLHFQSLDPDHPGIICSRPNVTVSTIPLQHRIPCTGFLFREIIKRRKLKKELLASDMTVEQIKLLKDGKDVFDQTGKLLYSYEEYTFQPEAPASYAYCSDTAFSNAVVPYLTEVDVLYHEATFLSDLEGLASKTLHSTALQAAEIAVKSGVKKLLIGHLSARYPDKEAALAEARSLFFATDFATEGTTLRIPF